MKKKFRVAEIIYIFSLLIMISTVAGCIPDVQEIPKEEEKPVRVALSQTEIANPWITDMINSFEMAAESNHMELIYHKPEQNTSDWQIKDISSLLNENIDYLVVSPRETTTLQDVLLKAKQKGIPVILVSRQADVRPWTFVTSISTDYVQEGRICAKILAQKYAGKICRVVEIQGTQGSSIARDRSSGFREEIKKYSNMGIIATEIGDFNRITAQRVMEHIIVNYPNRFDAVFAHSDEDGLGVLQALKVAGLKPGKNISIISVNGLQDVLKAIIAGEYTATVESNPRLGYVAFDIIAQLERNFMPAPQVVMPYQVIDSSNADKILELSY